ncbi:MAG TPA: hypothetical protein VLA34_00130 [Candidatus Krumholzibacterium sp.]|nr:hypothetical protein [Candidatus Krumholzibacterium sp.]
MTRAARSVFILLLIGAYSSVIQAETASVFDEDTVELSGLVLTGPQLEQPFQPGTALASPSDSIEVMEIEIPEEKDGNIYKEVAMVAVIVAFVGYIIVTYFFSSDETEDTGGGGKDLPTSVVPGH